MKAAFLQTFPPQVDLIQEGDTPDFLYVVMEGGVEIYAQSNGRETTMAVACPVSTFILAAVFTDEVFLMSARTLTKSRILMIPAESVRSIFEKDTGFAKATAWELAREYRKIVKAQKNLKLRTAVERLANYLLNEEAQNGDSGVVSLTMDKRTLAAYMGMTPENLSRAFATLKPYGVKVDASRISLLNKDSLTALAKPNSLIDGSE
jgi:CRP/FNR family transcriptional activator FtrB